jgi:hypothetical protein
VRLPVLIATSLDRVVDVLALEALPETFAPALDGLVDGLATETLPIGAPP